MARVIITFCLVLVCQAIVLASAVILEVNVFPLLLAPAIAVYAAFFYGPLESISTMILSGFVIDALLGAFIGVNISAMLLLWIFCVIAASWIGRPSWLMIFGFICGASVLFRVLIYVIVFGLTHHGGNFEILAFLWVPLVDGLMGVMMLRVLHSLLVRFGAIDPLDDAKVRLNQGA